MAYIFPVNPFDGQLYPIPAQPGSLQYQWSEELKVWLIYSPLGVQSVTGLLPIVVSNGTDNAVVSIVPATISTPGSMSAADKLKLDTIPEDASSGTVVVIGTGPGLTGGPIRVSGTIGLAPATTTTEGGVIIGEGIDVDNNGVISIPPARFGVTSINVGPGLVGAPSPITDTGTISAALATRLTVGSVRVGSGLNVAPDGTLSVAGSLGEVGILAWASVRILNNTDPPQFQLLEGYNISSIIWAPDQASQPRVQVNFQTPLANSNYGFAAGAGAYQVGTGSFQQTNFNITSGFKGTSFIQLQLCTLATQDWNVPASSSVVFSKWSAVPGVYPTGPSSFDIAIIDSQNF